MLSLLCTIVGLAKTALQHTPLFSDMYDMPPLKMDVFSFNFGDKNGGGGTSFPADLHKRV